MDEESQRRFLTTYTNSKDRGDFGSKFTFNTDSGGERYIVIEIDFLSQVSRFFNAMPKEQLTNVVCQLSAGILPHLHERKAQDVHPPPQRQS